MNGVDWDRIADQFVRHALSHVNVMLSFLGMLSIGLGLLAVANAIHELEAAIRNPSNDASNDRLKSVKN